MVNRVLTLGGGAKNNYVPATHTNYWGWSAEMDLKVGRMGSLRMQYNKDYLPNGSNGLVPSDWGRAVWIKVF
jgi:hypothetical protein